MRRSERPRTRSVVVIGDAGPAGSWSAFRTLQGVIGGTPVTVLVQNQMHPTDPDNHAHVGHRIDVGTAGGTGSPIPMAGDDLFGAPDTAERPR